MRIFVRICFIWPRFVILMIPCVQALDTHSEQTGNTFLVKVWLIWLWSFFFFFFCVACSKATKQHAAYDNLRQSFCLCSSLFHQDWVWPLKRQANWINMKFPVLLLSALLNPPLRKQRMSLVLDALCSCCQNKFLRWMLLFFRDAWLKKASSYMAPCGLLDDKLINMSRLWKATLPLIKRVRLAVARQNKISLFFKTGCPRAVPSQGFSVSKNPDPSPCHKVLFVNKTYNPNLTSCSLACIVQDRRVCL